MNGATKRSFQVMAVSTLVVLISGFVLAVLSTDAQASFRFVSWADTKSNRSELSQLSDQAAQLSPLFTIYPGDLESDGFTPSGMNQWKEAMDGQLTGDTSPNGMFNIVFPVRGNHDDRNTADWQAYFDLQGTADSVGATNYTNMPGQEDLTYSFDYENAHFIGVDVAGSIGNLTSGQITWIDNDLAAAEARGLTHAFLYWHGPIYCVDGHCSCSDRTGCISSTVESLIEVFNQHSIVSATFHGHEHTYAFTYIDDTRIPSSGSFEGVTHPFYQFVTGSAGAGPDSCNNNRCDYNMAENGFVTVDVDGPSVTVTFYQLGSMNPVNTINYIKEGVPPPPNEPPVASNDSVSTPVNTMVTINVAFNDSDPNGNLDPASANTNCATCAGPLNGWLVNHFDGTFDYTPDSNFTGPNSFVYEICDTEFLCDTATVNIIVTPHNEPPVANDDSTSIAEDTSVTINVAVNDSDPDPDDVLNLASVNTTCATCAEPVNGTLLNNGDGSFIYSPNTDFNGSDSFIYEICDTYSLCDTATVSITITPVPDPPTANDDSAGCIEGTPVIIDVADNDNDPDGDLNLNSINTTCTGCSAPANGSLVKSGEGTFVYTPNPGFNGSDSFVYEICDTDLTCDIAAVNITVTPPGPTVATLDAVSSGTTSSNILTISHTTSGSNRLMLVGVSINNDDLETVSSITYSGIPLTRDGFVNHQGSGGDDSRVEIWQLLDPPLGTYDVVISFSAVLRHYAVGGVITFSGVNQSDPLGAFASSYGDSSSASVAVPSASDELVVCVFACETCTSVSFLSPGVEGWNLAAGSGNTIGAGASVEGSGPAISVNASLGKGDHWAMGGISIRSSGIPSPANDPPVAADDIAITAEDTAVTINMATNDTDPDGNLNPGSVHEISSPSNGTLVDNGGGSCTFTPNVNFYGSDSFIYEICDTMGACDTATVTITVSAVNDAPAAQAQSVTTAENTSVAISLTASDVDGDSLTYSVVWGPANGTLSGTAPNLTYQPNANFSGSDSCTFRANDGTADSNVAMVSITVTAVNDIPVANADSATTAEDTAVTIDVLSNDTDTDGNPLTVSAITQGANGSVGVNADNTLTYTPNANFNGNDTFTYTASDGIAESSSATVTVTVSAVNDAPQFTSTPLTTATEDVPYSYAITTSDPDVGDTLAISATNLPSWLSLTDNGGGTATLNGTPTNAEVGDHSMVLHVTDDSLSDTQSFTITVNAVNDAPTVSITAPTNNSAFDEGIQITFDGTASDPEDGDLSAGLNWSSSINGDFGTGGSVSTTTLSVGTHTIIATATDSGSLNGSDQITVTINPPPNTAPSVSISAPAGGASFNDGDTITFSGSATDTEDGDLSANLSWLSSLDGAIGSGGSFNSSTLSVGVHSITASVTDSGSLPGSDQITITVNAMPNTIHIGNLQGIAMPVGKKKWKATVIIPVHASDESSVSDATVNGIWSDSSAGSCTTDISGQCEITSRPIADTEITFIVDSVTHLTLGYQPNDNHANPCSIIIPSP